MLTVLTFVCLDFLSFATYVGKSYSNERKNCPFYFDSKISLNNTMICLGIHLM